MKKILILVSLILSINLSANCRPDIEHELLKKITKLERVDHVGKVTTGGTFIVVGGFYGVMGVYLLGPLWAGAVVGATFGAAAALPVGAVFVINHQTQKRTISSLGKTLSIIDLGEEFENIFQKILIKRPDLTREVFMNELEILNVSKALCDGTVSKSNRVLPTWRLIATPKDIIRWFTHPNRAQLYLN